MLKLPNSIFLADADLGEIGATEGLGPFGDIASQAEEGPTLLANIVSNVIGVMTIVAGLWFIFNFFIAAVGIVIASGNEDAIKKNTQKISTSLLGLVIVIAGYALISLIGYVLGFDITNLGGLISNITP